MYEQDQPIIHHLRTVARPPDSRPARMDNNDNDTPDSFDDDEDVEQLQYKVVILGDGA
jgi:hypothetical protein